MAATTKAIQARHERTRLQLETVRMESQLNQLRARTAAPLLEAWGDIVNPYDWMDDDPTFGPPVWTAGAAMGDRADGRNSPIVQTENQLSAIRATARMLFEISAAAKCATKNLVNFIVGTGLTYKVVPRRKDQEVPEEVLTTVQAVVDDFLEANDWVGDQEREVLWRAIRDGETFLSLWPEGGRVSVRIVEPEQVSEPTPIPEYGHCYTFGIDTDAEDVQSVLGYWVRWNTVDQHDYLHAGNMEHVKRNVDRNIKRGLSDFYAVYQHLQRAEKLLRNAAEGAAIQAAIAYIREHVPGVTQSQVETLRGGDTLHQTYTYNTPNQGQKTRYVQKLEPGSVLDVGAGTQYKPGPLGSAHVPSFIAIEQAVLRFVGTNWCMPEYLISGDASNANYSSTMVAEAPFTKACEAEQALLCKRYKRLLWKVLAFAHGAGRLGGMPLEELRRLIDLQITGPRVAARNITDEVNRAKALNEAGILSRETWAADEGLDYQDEVSKGAEPAQKALPFTALRQGGGLPGERVEGAGDGGGVDEPAFESYEESEHPRDDNGQWITKDEIGAAKTDPAKAAQLRAKVTDPAQRAKLDKAIRGIKMTYTQAQQMAEAFRAIGGFTEVKVDHHGFWSKRTPELEADGKWRVELWSVNPRAGNRNLEVVETFDLASVPLLARKAKGQATARDKKALARIAAEREVNESYRNINESRRARLARAAEPAFESYEESEHPRGDDGKWITKDEIGAAKGDPKKAAELRSKVTDPQQRAKLDKAIGDKQSGGRVTDTPEFKAWFGNSKITNTDGTPKRVYHGTAANFPDFKQGRIEGGAIFFTTKPSLADEFAALRGDIGQNLIPVYLRVENPYVVDFKGQLYTPQAIEKIMERAHGRGHDGVILRNIQNFEGGKLSASIAVFSATQIKSASGNRGTFDPNSPNINESRRARLAQAAELIWEGYP